MSEKTCSRCKSDNLQDGKFMGFSLVGFQPWIKGPKGAGIHILSATACLDCGTVDFSIDPEVVKDAVRKAEAEDK